MGEGVTNIRFIPINKNRSHVGFISFNIGDIEIRDVAVHVRRDEKGYRLVYPKNKESEKHIVRPITKVAQEEIDKAVTEHIQKEGAC